MTKRSIEELIERSSLGTPAAKAARASVPEEVAQRVVHRAQEIAEERWPTPCKACQAPVGHPCVPSYPGWPKGALLGFEHRVRLGER
jgi:hypothetical protein